MVKNIQTMMPKDILVKEAFRRIVPSGLLTSTGAIARDTGGYAARTDYSRDPLRFEILSQDDFLREFDVNSHKINSIKYYPNGIQTGDKGKTRKYNAKVKSRVAIAWQKRIYTKRLASLTGNNIDLNIANAVSGQEEMDTLALFREGWAVKNIENAIYQAIASDGKVGDCAIVFYKDANRKVKWRGLGFDKGDRLYPHYDPENGELCLLGRKYSSFEGEQEIEYLDVWDNTYYARWKYDKEQAEGEKKGAWVLDQPAKRHNFSRIPVAYHRYGEPFWANSQSLIDAHELAMSQLAENNASYALRILYTLGADMELDTALDGTPTRIDSTDPNAKIGYLDSADKSTSYELQLNSLEKNIMRCSFAVETPEIKSGSDLSSLTVKMLFADSYQKALEDAQEYQPFLDAVVEIFKEGYGTESGKIMQFNRLLVKATIEPWIFMSESESVNNMVQLHGAGGLSSRSIADKASEMGYGTIDEYNRVLQEEHDALLSATSVTAQKDVNVVAQARNAE